MTSTTFFFVFVPLLAVILLAVNLIFAPHNPYDEKDSAFECGFHSFLGQNRTQFSISFFIFALLFLLFDLEILLVYPYVVSAYTNGIYGLVIMLVFFLALTLGFAFELGKNALKIESRQMLSLDNLKTNTVTFVSSILSLISFTLNSKKSIGITTTLWFSRPISDNSSPNSNEGVPDLGHAPDDDSSALTETEVHTPMPETSFIERDVTPMPQNVDREIARVREEHRTQDERDEGVGRGVSVQDRRQEASELPTRHLVAREIRLAEVREAENRLLEEALPWSQPTDEQDWGEFYGGFTAAQAAFPTATAPGTASASAPATASASAPATASASLPGIETATQLGYEAELSVSNSRHKRNYSQVEDNNDQSGENKKHNTNNTDPSNENPQEENNSNSPSAAEPEATRVETEARDSSEEVEEIGRGSGPSFRGFYSAYKAQQAAYDERMRAAEVENENNPNPSNESPEEENNPNTSNESPEEENNPNTSNESPVDEAEDESSESPVDEAEDESSGIEEVQRDTNLDFYTSFLTDRTAAVEAESWANATAAASSYLPGTETDTQPGYDAELSASNSRHKRNYSQVEDNNDQSGENKKHNTNNTDPSNENPQEEKSSDLSSENSEDNNSNPSNENPNEENNPLSESSEYEAEDEANESSSEEDDDESNESSSEEDDDESNESSSEEDDDDDDNNDPPSESPRDDNNDASKDDNNDASSQSPIDDNNDDASSQSGGEENKEKSSQSPREDNSENPREDNSESPKDENKEKSSQQSPLDYVLEKQSMDTYDFTDDLD